MSEMTAFRDSQVVILDTDRTIIKAGIGLHELLRAPTVELPARVGLRTNTSLAIHAALNGANGIAVNGSTSKSQPEIYLNGSSSKPKAKVSDYLVGSTLDEALANGEDIDVFWPFESGTITDWVQAEALWKHVLFNRLGLRRSQNESPVILSVPSSLARRTYERITQLFFERLNVPGFSIIQRPLAQLYAANSVSGLVIDINRETTELTPIVDTTIQHSARVILDVGIKHCEIHLANMLRSNQPLIKAISPAESPLSEDKLTETLCNIAEHVWREGLVKVPADSEFVPVEEEGLTDIAAVLVAGKEKAIIESNLKKKATAKANAAERERAKEIEALDLVQTRYGDITVTLGKERHRFCEPLFDAQVQARLRNINPSSAIPIQEGMHLAIRGVDVDYRLKVWDGIFITGEISSAVKGMGPALQTYLASSYILSNIDSLSDVQAKHTRILKVPEFFANFRENGDRYSAYLGLSIVAKTLFSEPANQTFVSKPDYNKMGPRAIIDLVPTVL